MPTCMRSALPTDVTIRCERLSAADAGASQSHCKGVLLADPVRSFHGLLNEFNKRAVVHRLCRPVWARQLLPRFQPVSGPYRVRRIGTGA